MSKPHDTNYIYWMLENLMAGSDTVDDIYVNSRALEILGEVSPSAIDIKQADEIIKISNILYNSTDRPILPLDDGIYDMLMVWITRYKPDYQVGGLDVVLPQSDISLEPTKGGLIIPMKRIETKPGMSDDQMMFKNDIRAKRVMDRNMFLQTPMFRTEPLKKQNVNTKHNYPKLVGTLDKCKFVLNQQAIDKNVFNDANVQVFERDFIQKLMDRNIINPFDIYTMVLELKYDGVSVEAEVSDRVHTALSRGDTNNDMATDLSPVLRGYRFPKADGVIDPNETFGMKFEAMIGNVDLSDLGVRREKSYKNPRNAMTGLLGASDANRWIDYITLVPLATSLDMDRLSEIEFMNKYYDSGEILRYAVIEGNYKELLFQVKRFVDEAEFLRPIMPYIYDGVVCSFIDPNIINTLGRVNSVNKWQMAIKFNPQNALTVFTGYDFSVAQNGIITPRAFYKPVELFGCTHYKTTVHSYKRFMELSLKIGDIVKIELINDVIPYISKMEIKDNEFNSNEVIPFPITCPSCNSTLELSKTGKTAFCPNHKCPGRALAIVVNMLKKISFKDFSEESIKQVGHIHNLKDLLNTKYEDVQCLGDVEGANFMARIEELKIKPINDYNIIGSLGFSDVAEAKWKLILHDIPIQRILSPDPNLRNELLMIKGIGPSTADTIEAELDVFYDDLVTITTMSNVIWTYGAKSNKKIRFTGIRDKNLIEQLSIRGYDITDKSGVPKDTDILLIPYEGFFNNKTNNVGKDCIVVDIETFKNNITMYLQDNI